MMSSRCLNSVKNYSKLNINHKLFTNKGFNNKNINFNKLNAKSYVTWGSFSKNNLNLKFVFAGVAGIGIYSIHQIYKNKTSFNSVITPFSKVLALEEKNDQKYRDYLKVKPTRKIRSNTDNGKFKLTFFQYQSCPFCCKVRAFLDYHGFSYDVVEVNSFTRKEIKWAEGYKKVPMLMVRNEQTGETVLLKDSSAIISCLQTTFVQPDQSIGSLWGYYPTIEDTNKKGKVVYEVSNRYRIMYGEKNEAPADFMEVKKWREWTDQHFVHTISPNIYRTPSEAYDTFKIFSKVGEWENIFSGAERAAIFTAGSSAMYLIGKMLKKRHNLSNDVRLDLYAGCHEWMRGVKRANKANGGRFMGGGKPNLADLAMYGVVNAMEGTLAFEDVMKNTNIEEWFYAVKSEIACNAGKRVVLDGGEVNLGEGKIGRVNV